MNLGLLASHEWLVEILPKPGRKHWENNRAGMRGLWNLLSLRCLGNIQIEESTKKLRFQV